MLQFMGSQRIGHNLVTEQQQSYMVEFSGQRSSSLVPLSSSCLSAENHAHLCKTHPRNFVFRIPLAPFLMVCSALFALRFFVFFFFGSSISPFAYLDSVSSLLFFLSSLQQPGLTFPSWCCHLPWHLLPGLLCGCNGQGELEAATWPPWSEKGLYYS